jgi:hypothetical protein
MKTNESLHRRAGVYAAVEASVLLCLAAVQIATIHIMFRHHRAGKGIIGVKLG